MIKLKKEGKVKGSEEARRKRVQGKGGGKKGTERKGRLWKVMKGEAKEYEGRDKKRREHKERITKVR